MVNRVRSYFPNGGHPATQTDLIIAHEPLFYTIEQGIYRGKRFSSLVIKHTFCVQI